MAMKLGKINKNNGIIVQTAVMMIREASLVVIVTVTVLRIVTNSHVIRNKNAHSINEV